MIYTYTSIFPGQLTDLLTGSDEIVTFATEIIEAAQAILSDSGYEVRSLVFSLFMAGFATNDLVKKQTALNLLLAIETHDYEGSTKCTRSLLQKLYKKQEIATREYGNANSVDWLEEMQKSGQRFIM